MAVGQFFSQRFGYGIHALGYIAKKPLGQLTTLPELAQWMQTIWPSASATYLSNIVQRLARGGLLQSHRGVGGGYSLARSADKISLRDAVEVLEGILTQRCGLSLEETCPSSDLCSIQKKMSRLEEAFLESMAQVSVRELAESIRVPGMEEENGLFENQKSVVATISISDSKESLCRRSTGESRSAETGGRTDAADD